MSAQAAVCSPRSKLTCSRNTEFLETRSPSLEDLCTLSQNRLTKEDFMRSEAKILAKLDWQLAVPSPHAFGSRTR